LWLDHNDSASAQRVYDAAQPALVRTRQYSICMKYLDPDKAMQSAARFFASAKNIPEPDVGLIARLFGANPSSATFAEKDFLNRSTTIVALLAVNGQQSRAEEMARRAEAIHSSAQLQAAMQNALKGIVPDPWPAQD
jgi:hypothetical protein